MLRDGTVAQSVLDQLIALGCQLSLDDFGTGYSSLAQLQRIPFTELKIDRRFIANFLHEAESQAIVETCINLAHKMHIRTVAEGVETERHGVRLLQLGYQLAQGYAIAKPMPAATVVEWVQQWQPPASWQRSH